MKIVVLLAAYNGEAYIGEQLDSILGQTVPGLEILVSDDGSTDRTRSILENYRKRWPGQIRLLHRPEQGQPKNCPKQSRLPNRPKQGQPLFQQEQVQSMNRPEQSRPLHQQEAGTGAWTGENMPAPARNFFWLISRAGDADYVMLSDQDDVWDRRKTEILLKRFRGIEAGTPAVAFSDMEIVDARLRRIAPSFFAYSHCDPDRTSFAEILVENPVTGGSVMMNRELVRLLDPLPAVCFMHDWWIALCAACFGSLLCVKQPLYRYRQHGGNVLGAQATGSLQDMKKRLTRKEQVEENYRLMFAQAAEFGRLYASRMRPELRCVLRSYLALPLQSPAGRLRNIVRNHFYKSSPLQTLAQCFTIPGPNGWEERI